MKAYETFLIQRFLTLALISFLYFDHRLHKRMMFVLLLRLLLLSLLYLFFFLFLLFYIMCCLFIFHVEAEKERLQQQNRKISNLIRMIRRYPLHFIDLVLFLLQCSLLTCFVIIVPDVAIKHEDTIN